MYKYDMGHAPINNITRNTALNREMTQLSKKGLKQMESSLGLAKEYDNALKYAKRYTIAYYTVLSMLAACPAIVGISLLVGNKIAASKLTKLRNPVKNVASPINLEKAQAALKETFVCMPDAIKSGAQKSLNIIK